jgi:hypothetical protein
MASTNKRKFIDYELNNRWAKTAFQACTLHDRLMDCIKVYYGLGVDLGCRTALETDIRPGIRKMEKGFKDLPRQLDVAKMINGLYVDFGP